MELKWDPSRDKIGRKKRMGSEIKEVARCTNEEELCQVRERKKSGSFEHMLKDCSMYGESRPEIPRNKNNRRITKASIEEDVRRFHCFVQSATRIFISKLSFRTM